MLILGSKLSKGKVSRTAYLISLVGIHHIIFKQSISSFSKRLNLGKTNVKLSYSLSFNLQCILAVFFPIQGSLGHQNAPSDFCFG